MSDPSDKNTIFQRMQAGETLHKDAPDYARFDEVVSRTIRLCADMNTTATDVD